MRIIAGKWRSRRLVRPEVETTRPLPDRVKESLFSILGHHFETPGELPGLNVADVFAGSGAIGLESLSRGAESCVFFERSPIALKALRKNIESLGAEVDSTVVAGDAWRSAGYSPDRKPFDLMFLDPPYQDVEDVSPRGAIHRFLSKLAESPDYRPLVVFHHPQKSRFGVSESQTWRILDERIIGTNKITILSR